MSPASTEGWFTGSTGATALTFRSPRRGSDEQTSRVGGELNAVEEQDSVDHRFQTVRGQVERPHVPWRCAMIEIAARGIGDPQAAVGSHYAVAGEYRGAATKCAVRRPRDAALTRMRAKVSTCSLTVRKLAALFGVPAQGPSPAERDVAHGCPPGERVWVRLRISTFGCRFECA